MVLACDDTTDAAAEFAEYHTGTTCETDDVYLVTEVIGLLHERDGQDDTLLSRTVDVHITGTVVHTDDTVVERVDAYELSAGIAATGKERLIDLLAEHAYLAVLCHVHRVDIAAIVEAGLLHLGVVGFHALDAGRTLLVTKDDHAAPTCHHRRDHVEFGNLSFQPVYVLVDHIPLPSLAETVVGLRRRLRKDEC